MIDLADIGGLEKDARASVRYNPVAVVLHWMTALMILAAVTLGASLGSLPRVQESIKYYNIHKWLGVVVLLTTCIRIWWRWRHPPPPLPSSVSRWQRTAARAVHTLLYVLLVSIPLVGWCASSAGGHHLNLFGVLPLPAPVPTSKVLNEQLHVVHSWLAWTLVAVVAIHVLAVAKHLLVDRSGVLGRMTIGPRRR